jgi:hypothetical protein
VPQTVTVTGVDDHVVDGDAEYSIVLSAAEGGDAHYTGMDATDVFVTNTDDDVAGVTVTPTAGLVTSEAGGREGFNVVLTSEPTADVTIAVHTSDASEGSADVSSLTFTASDWNVPQTVTVTGADDHVVDGNTEYSIVLDNAVSADPIYEGMDVADVFVTNTDDDAAGITVTPTAGLTTTEAGGTATFEVVLASEPTADVTIPVASDHTGEGVVSTSQLTFTAADWNVPQTVTVTGVDDAIQDGDVAYNVTLGAATSADPLYSGMDATDVSLSNTDDDAAGITVTPTAGLTTSESGGTASFTVVLRSQPVADVTVPISSGQRRRGPRRREHPDVHLGRLECAADGHGHGRG